MKVPVGPGWSHELKHDGFRIVALKDGDEVRLWSRNGRNWSADFLAIRAAVMALPAARIVLDGEAVAHCPTFNALLRRSGCATACLYAFDLIHVGDEDLRGLALVERRALLREHLKRAEPALLYSDHLNGADGEAMWPRLRHGARRYRVEARRQPLQKRTLLELGEGEEPGLRAAVPVTPRQYLHLEFARHWQGAAKESACDQIAQNATGMLKEQ